jgi:amino acid transporter
MGHSTRGVDMPESYEPAVLSLDDDARRLKELGYDQELERSWSGFTNFAISFSIISILAGCFTTYGQAWNNGGPVAISIGWPVICGFILIIGLCMSEILSAYPTAGGIYYWALRLGGPGWGWFTGWFNMVGLSASWHRSTTAPRSSAPTRSACSTRGMTHSA